MFDHEGIKLEIGDEIMYWTLPNPYGFRMSSGIIGFDGDYVIVRSGERWPLKDVRFLWKNRTAAHEQVTLVAGLSGDSSE